MEIGRFIPERFARLARVATAAVTAAAFASLPIPSVSAQEVHTPIDWRNPNLRYHYSLEVEFTIFPPENPEGSYITVPTLFFDPYLGPGISLGYSRRLSAEVAEADGSTRVSFQALVENWQDQLNSRNAYLTATTPSGLVLEAGVPHSVSATATSEGDFCRLDFSVDGVETSTEIFKPGCQIVEETSADRQFGTPPPGAGGISGVPLTGEVSVAMAKYYLLHE